MKTEQSKVLNRDYGEDHIRADLKFFHREFQKMSEYIWAWSKSKGIDNVPD